MGLHEVVRKLIMERDELLLKLLEAQREMAQLRRIRFEVLRRRLAAICHPDRGGSPGMLAEINAALDGV